MSHEIRIPHRDRSDPLSSVGELARHLSPDESATVREIVTDAAGAGLTTVGALLNRLEAASPAERRALLDQARTRAGLPTATAIAKKASHEERSRQMFVAGADDPELRFALGPAGWIDVDAAKIEAARSRAEQERRAAEAARRRAAREAQLPELEREEAAEALAWRSANVHVERNA